MHRLLSCLLSVTVASAGVAPLAAAEPVVQPQSSHVSAASASSLASPKFPPYRNRFGRERPVVAVIAENSGTELVDFLVPYGVLSQSGVVDVVAVATRTGPVRMRPALTLQAQSSIAEFDARFPAGADYVIVPAVVRRDDADLLRWIVEQADSGATVVSICDGALVLANAGLLDQRRATAHWASESLRTKHYPATDWVPNVRYVIDGRVASSAGISAALPISLALVEAIAGHEATVALAQKLGVDDWSAVHDSDRFKPRVGNLRAFAATHFTNGWFHASESIGIPVSTGVDEIELALTADAYSRTGRSQAFSVAASPAPVQTRHGLLLVPDRSPAGGESPDRVLPAFDAELPGQALDRALAGIATRYGRATAQGVALDFEYPGAQ